MINRLSPKVRTGIGFLLLLCVPLIFLAALHLGKDAEIPDADPEKVAQYTPPVLNKEINEEISTATEEDKKDAKEVAAAFVAAFHSIDPEQPHAYFDKSKEYMTEELREQYQSIPKRGTLEAQDVEVIAMESTPTELQSDLQIWTVDLINELTATDGSTSMEADQYSVMLVKLEGQWFVDGVTVNAQD